MTYMVNHPRVLALVCIVVMWVMALLGVGIRRWLNVSEQEDRENLGMVVSATLTLLGLIIGFTFSMAATRYDQRRLYEEDEANAIGTEYVRAELLPPAETVTVKELLRRYLAARIEFYHSGYHGVSRVDARTAALQGPLWEAVRPQAAAAPTPVTALVVSGMNDVLNSQGYTQFAWWNRIPASAWGLMIVIALFSNLLVGYATKRSRAGNLLLAVLPLIVSVSFFLVADIDSPRGGVIRVEPVDLLSLQQQIGQ